MRRVVSTVLATAALAGLAGARGFGQSEEGVVQEHRQRPCSEATLRGDYGIQIQGIRPAGPGVTESVVGVVIRTYDGEGGFTQIANLHGSISGTVHDLEGSGTYEVSPNCTGVAFVTAGPVTIEDRLVIVDDGREVRTATMSPAPSMVTGVQRKIHVR